MALVSILERGGRAVVLGSVNVRAGATDNVAATGCVEDDEQHIEECDTSNTERDERGECTDSRSAGEKESDPAVRGHFAQLLQRVLGAYRDVLIVVAMGDTECDEHRVFEVAPYVVNAGAQVLFFPSFVVPMDVAPHASPSRSDMVQEGMQQRSLAQRAPPYSELEPFLIVAQHICAQLTEERRNVVIISAAGEWERCGAMACAVGLELGSFASPNSAIAHVHNACRRVQHGPGGALFRCGAAPAGAATFSFLTHLHRCSVATAREDRYGRLDSLLLRLSKYASDTALEEVDYAERVEVVRVLLQLTENDAFRRTMMEHFGALLDLVEGEHVKLSHYALLTIRSLAQRESAQTAERLDMVSGIARLLSLLKIECAKLKASVNCDTMNEELREQMEICEHTIYYVLGCITPLLKMRGKLEEFCSREGPSILIDMLQHVDAIVNDADSARVSVLPLIECIALNALVHITKTKQRVRVLLSEEVRLQLLTGLLQTSLNGAKENGSDDSPGTKIVVDLASIMRILCKEDNEVRKRLCKLEMPHLLIQYLRYSREQHEACATYPSIVLFTLLLHTLEIVCSRTRSVQRTFIAAGALELSLSILAEDCPTPQEDRVDLEAVPSSVVPSNGCSSESAYKECTESREMSHRECGPARQHHNNAQFTSIASEIILQLVDGNATAYDAIMELDGLQVLTGCLMDLHKNPTKYVIHSNILKCLASLTSNSVECVHVLARTTLLELLNPSYLASLACNTETCKSTLLAHVCNASILAFTVAAANERLLVSALNLIANICSSHFGRCGVLHCDGTIDRSLLGEAQRDVRELGLLGVVLNMTSLSISFPARVQQALSRTLRAVATQNSLNARAIISCDAIASLVKMTASADALVIDGAITAILAVLETNIDRAATCIIGHGFLVTATQLLSHTTAPQLQLPTVKCICLMVEDETAKRQFSECGGVSVLVNSLAVKDKGVLAVTAAAISKLALRTPALKYELYSSGAIPKLVSLLREKMPRPRDEDEAQCNRVYSSVLRALVSLADEDVNNRQAMIRARVLYHALLLSEKEDEQVLVEVCRLLWVLAEGGSQFQDSIRDADERTVSPLFVRLPKLLLHYEEEVAINAAGAIAAICDSNLKNKNLFRANDCIDMLQMMPETSNPRLLEVCATALKHLITE